MPISVAWFCAGQYTKLRNIAEDYAYKTMLAQSIYLECWSFRCFIFVIFRK
jgi:hypothetical protein